MSWQTMTLGDVVTLKRGHDLPERDRREGPVPIVSSSGVTGFHNVAKAEPPGVVTGRYGTLGEVYFINEPYWPLNTSLYAIDFHENDPKFVAYFLRQVLKGASSNNKAAVPGVNRNDLHALKVNVPIRDVQERIAGMLTAYDDLIENNLRRIKLLEEAARLIYREWFVRFRFPGYEHIELETGVPKDWRKAPLGALVAIRKGKNITKETVMEGQVPVVAGGLQPAYFHNTANVPGPAVTVSASGANAGFVNLYHTDIWASDCSYISSDATPNVYFFFLLLRDRHSEIHAMQKGAAQPHVYPKDLERLVVLYPSDALLQEFADLVAPVFRQIRVLQDQSRKLGEARNLLLPRLMSGEVQI